MRMSPWLSNAIPVPASYAFCEEGENRQSSPPLESYFDTKNPTGAADPVKYALLSASTANPNPVPENRLPRSSSKRRAQSKPPAELYFAKNGVAPSGAGAE